jgi:hypothetical protein
MNKKNIFTGFLVVLFALLLLAPITAQEKPVKEKKCSTEAQQVCKEECKTKCGTSAEKCCDNANCENCKMNCGDKCTMDKCDKAKSDSKCVKKCDATTEKSENPMNYGTETK